MNSFDYYKQKISIIDLLGKLGYRQDVSKGKNAPVFKLYDSNNMKVDEVVIKNPRTSKEYYFDRNYNKGDLINFVLNNLDKFPEFQDKNKFVQVNKILSHFSNNPFVSEFTSAGSNNSKKFEADRYQILDSRDFKYLNSRGINDKVINLFSPFILKIKDKNSKYNFVNTGFPYRVPGSREVTNYELRNFNFKGMASGGDKSNSAWVADFSNNHHLVKNVFLFESAIDALSFYQLKKDKIAIKNAAFVSLGGYVSDNQIKNLQKHFPNAQFTSCFDNDLNGHIYDIKVNSLLKGDKLDIKISKENNNVSFSFNNNDKIINLKIDNVSLHNFSKLTEKSILVAMKPKLGKDYNEMLNTLLSNKMSEKFEYKKKSNSLSY